MLPSLCLNMYIYVCVKQREEVCFLSSSSHIISKSLTVVSLPWAERRPNFQKKERNFISLKVEIYSPFFPLIPLIQYLCIFRIPVIPPFHICCLKGFKCGMGRIAHFLVEITVYKRGIYFNIWLFTVPSIPLWGRWVV